VLDAIRKHRHEIANSSPPRVLEEYYKILRAGSAERSFRWLAELGLLEPISAELHRGADERMWQSLAALDAYRRQFESTPETLTNAVLMGTLLVPLGISLQHERRGITEESRGAERRRHPALQLGELPLARRDVERLRQILGLQRRLRDLSASPRAQRALARRHIFRDALTWLEIHGSVPDIAEHWKALLAEGASGESVTVTDGEGGEKLPFKRRRRRRRRGLRPVP